MRALWVSLLVLGATALAQAVVVAVSGSVALLGDTVHNTADALTAVPLGIAFVLGRRAATRRFTYGYGRAEDLAGLVIVLTIAASAVFAGWTAVARLLDPRPVEHVPVVAVAALVGFAGNEWVARYRIRVGRAIGSAALVADGLHARTDGFTSLAVLAGAGGAALGWQWADPVVGLAITAAIVLVLRDAAREVFRRMMDAVDPALVDRPSGPCGTSRASGRSASCGCAGSGTGCAPRWPWSSTVRRRSVRRTPSRWTPSTRCCTPSPGSRRPWCTPIRRRRRARTTRTTRSRTT